MGVGGGGGGACSSSLNPNEGGYEWLVREGERSGTSKNEKNMSTYM